MQKARPNMTPREGMEQATLFNWAKMQSWKYPELDHALTQFARENNCTYDEAYILAKTGKRMF